jgi:SAM-dependent methyltransferase
MQTEVQTVSEAALAYWNAAAENYAQAFTGTFVGNLWRQTVWKELDKAFPRNSRVLELNCGTGIDAIHLARRGVSVLACDLSSRMVELAQQGAAAAGADNLQFRVLPTEQLATLETDPLFDGAFSNFSGLNCVEDLSSVRRALASRLKPGAPVLLCMLGRIGVWRRLRHVADADWKKALSGAPAIHIENAFIVRSPSQKQIIALFSPDFRLRSARGIGITVPPAYLDHWAVRHRWLTHGLNFLERLLGGLPGFRNLGECILLRFERMPVDHEVGCQ